MPTRLFDALTMPVIPVVPLPHVTARWGHTQVTMGSFMVAFRALLI